MRGIRPNFFPKNFFIQDSKNSSHPESIHTMFCISKYIRNIFETILKIKNWWPKNWFFQVKKFLWFGSVHAIYCVSWVNYWPKIWKKMTKISPELKFKFEKNFTKISPKLKEIFNGPYLLISVTKNMKRWKGDTTKYQSEILFFISGNTHR